MNTNMIRNAFVALSMLLSTASYAQEATPEVSKATEVAKPLTAKQQQARINIKACGVEWKAAKASQNTKTPDGLTWPKYWSACNARLKASKAQNNG